MKLNQRGREETREARENWKSRAENVVRMGGVKVEPK